MVKSQVLRKDRQREKKHEVVESSFHGIGHHTNHDDARGDFKPDSHVHSHSQFVDSQYFSQDRRVQGVSNLL